MLEKKQKEYNWYYTQCFIDVKGESFSRCRYFVTFAKNPTEAKQIALDYVFEHKNELELEDLAIGLTKDNIHLYQKNYIRESRELLEKGRFAGVKPEGI